jgi:N6-adenosine-specific RNA methylase IME4
VEFHEIANLFPMMQPDELADLVADIKVNGLIEPIILYEDQILDGRNRYLACGEAGVKPRFEVYSGDEPVSFVISKNLKRRHLNGSQKAMIATEIRPALEEEARKRQAHGMTAPGKTLVELVPEASDGSSSDKAGEVIGISGQYVSEAEKIKREAPEYVKPIMDGEMTITKAKREIQKKINDSKPKPKLPDDKYEVIYADPPWNYDNSGFAQSAASQYPTMSIDDICELRIDKLTVHNSVLFLWATSPLLPDAFKVIEAWGFNYKASMVWVKDRAPGMGWWINTKHELLLIACKDINHPAIKLDSVIRASVTIHSKKPAEFYEAIEEMYPESKKIELFARQARKGWEAWGNEQI